MDTPPVFTGGFVFTFIKIQKMPNVGTIVLYYGNLFDPFANPQAPTQPAAAIVTKDNGDTVNLTIFVDNNPQVKIRKDVKHYTATGDGRAEYRLTTDPTPGEPL